MTIRPVNRADEVPEPRKPKWHKIKNGTVIASGKRTRWVWIDGDIHAMSFDEYRDYIHSLEVSKGLKG